MGDVPHLMTAVTYLLVSDIVLCGACSSSPSRIGVPLRPGQGWMLHIYPPGLELSHFYPAVLGQMPGAVAVVTLAHLLG